MAMVTLSGVSGAFATGPSCSGDSLEVETPGEVTVHARNWADVLADGGCGYRVRSRASFEDGQGEWDFEGDIDVAASYAWQRWWQWATDGSGGWRRSWSKPSLERCTFDLAPQGWGEYEVEVRSGSCTEDVTLTVKPQIVGIAVEHAAVAVAGWDEDTERIVLYYEPNSGNSEFDTYIDGRDSLLGWVKLRSQLDADGAAPDTTDAAKVDFIDPTDATESLDLTGFGKVMETSAGDRFAILRNDDGEDSTFFMAVDDGTGEFYAALDGDGEVIALHEVDALDGAKFGVNYPVLVEDESGNDVVMLVYMADLYKQAITAELSDALDPADHSADWLGNSIRWLFGAVPADLDELVLSPELDPDELQDLVVDRLLDGAGEGLTTLELCDGDSEISEKAQALFPMGDWCKRTTAIDPVVVRTWRDEEEVVLVLGDVGAAWLSSWVLVDEDDTPSLSGRRLRYEGQLITTDEAEEFLDDDVTVCMLIDPAAVTDPLTGVLHVYATMRLSYMYPRMPIAA